jgi:hypothetical protein
MFSLCTPRSPPMSIYTTAIVKRDRFLLLYEGLARYTQYKHKDKHKDVVHYMFARKFASFRALRVRESGRTLEMVCALARLPN